MLNTFILIQDSYSVLSANTKLKPEEELNV